MIKNYDFSIGAVHVVKPGLTVADSVQNDTLLIHDLASIFDALGIVKSDFLEWQQKFGFDSGGLSDTGEPFVPGYPMLSRLGWIHIISVRISVEDLLELAAECERASAAAELGAGSVLRQIASLAKRANALGADLIFGPP